VSYESGSANLADSSKQHSQLHGSVSVESEEARRSKYCIVLDRLWAKFEAKHELIRAHLKEAFDESEYSMTGFADSTEITYVEQ